jgi:hypothetical protein
VEESEDSKSGGGVCRLLESEVAEMPCTRTRAITSNGVASTLDAALTKLDNISWILKYIFT